VVLKATIVIAVAIFMLDDQREDLRDRLTGFLGPDECHLDEQSFE